MTSAPGVVALAPTTSGRLGLAILQSVVFCPVQTAEAKPLRLLHLREEPRRPVISSDGMWKAQLVTIKVKRAYDLPAPGDGFRVLVDRLWPRGLSKERAAVDEWLREVAPSTDLRRWFAHDPARWAQFKRRYSAELEAPAALDTVARLRSLTAEGDITLLYAAKDELHNNAVALREHLASSCRHGSRTDSARQGTG